MKLITDYPVALDSPDHHHLAGTASDNTRNKTFNNLLYSFYPNKKLSILDLGCSGGGFVLDCLEDGHIAIGLEGSDFSKKTSRACWPIIPNNLFTCDISKDFQIVDDNDENQKFDVITMWDVLEHFKKEELDIVFNNIFKHLDNNGIFIASIALCVDIYNPVHQNVESIEWWLDFLENKGLIPDLEKNHIVKDNFLRNPHKNNNPYYLNSILIADNDIFCSFFKRK